MNKRNLRKLLTRLEHIDEDLWDMGTASGPCGCFIEHTCQALDLLRSPKSYAEASTRSPACQAALGLSRAAWVALSMPNQGDLAWWACRFHLDPDFVSLDRAIKVLRNLIETGEVDWRIR